MKFENIDIDGVEIVQLIHNDQILFGVAPAYGARLTELSLKHNHNFHSVLWPVSTDDCKKGAWSKNEILFPFPNRIEDGKYRFEGQSYQLPTNETAFNNAIHGLVAQAPFAVVGQEIMGNTASLTLRHTYDGSKDYYPFAFNLDATFVYDMTGAFKIVLNAENTGTQTLPFGLGWHPYFKMGDKGLENFVLTIPKTDHLILGERNLPTGEEMPFDHTTLKVADWQLDDCFRLQNEGLLCRLESDVINLKLTGSSAYKYLQIFTPKDLGTIAIEPMTSGVNVFNNKEGLRLLKPNEHFELYFAITVD